MAPASLVTSLAASRPEAHTERPYPCRVIMPDVPMSIEKTETRLMNKAVQYLGRYSASEQRLREVLGRFAKRKLADTEPAEAASATNNVVEKCLRLGYIDDAVFAANQVRGQRRQGKSTLAIRQRLRQHALDDAAITMALQTADANHQDAEMMAAAQSRRSDIDMQPLAMEPARRSDNDDVRSRRLTILNTAGARGAVTFASPSQASNRSMSPRLSARPA